MKKAFIILSTLLALVISLQAQTDSCSNELKGVIQDVVSRESLPYVQVQVKGTNKITFTDEEGRFKFNNLCKEQNTLIISCIGYCDTVCENYHEHHKKPHIYLKERVYSMEDVVINVGTNHEEGTESIAQESIEKEELNENPTQTLADALSQVEGVTFTSAGNNVKIPVIHGLYGNRILILNNGFKHGFQNWGTDHAPEIDVASADRITLIKGASGVKYGPEAIGGAIVVESNPLYFDEPFYLNTKTGYQTNGRGYFLNSDVGQGFEKWSYHLGVNVVQIGDRFAPDYVLTNSGKKEQSLNAGLRYNHKKWDVKLYYSFLNQELALLRSSIAESGNAFIRALESDEPTIIQPFSYQINEPNQQTQHHLGKAEVNWWYSDEAKLTLRLGKQLNRREEYDVRRNADKPIIDLDLSTNDYQLEWQHPSWFNLEGLMGLQVFTQDNDNNPGTGTTPFIPNYNTTRYSGFIIESYTKGKNNLETGARLDYEFNNVRGRETNQEVYRDEFEFTNLTASIGYVRQVKEHSTFRTNLGTAWRTPNMSELYTFGQNGFKTSFGLLRYYTNDAGQLRTNRVSLLNDSGISPEKGYKWINEWQTRGEKNTLTITAYSHYIQNFIFDRPVGVTGTVRGPMPVFIYDQADALFFGSDFTWQKDWTEDITGSFGFSYLWSRNTEKNESLINQAPLTTHYKIDWKIPSFWKVESSKLTLKPSYTFRQFQNAQVITPQEIINGTKTVTPESEIFDFKEAPDGYFLLNLAWKFRVKSFGGSITVNNVLNTRYRDYLNEMRYFSDEMGRNILFTINYKFKSKLNKHEHSELL